MLKEFKAFLMQGNILSLALGVIIGGAFGPVIASMVDDILMPPIGYLLGGTNFTALSYEIGEGVVIGYGKFIQAIINFVIISLCVFAIMKSMDRFSKKEEAAPAAPPAPSNQEVLLAEIRDLLKK